MKRCSKCKVEKPKSKFYKKSHNPDIFTNHCRRYILDWRKEHYSKYPEKKNKLHESYKKWYEKNKDVQQKKARERFQKMPMEYKRNVRLLKFYGITQKEYDKLYEEQNGKCAICGIIASDKKGTKKDILRVDHDHATKKIRGLLCLKCNTMIGLADENIERLKNAIMYLNESVFEESLEVYNEKR